VEREITIIDPLTRNECDVIVDDKDTVGELVQVAVNEFELLTGNYYLVKGKTVLAPEMTVGQAGLRPGDVLSLAPDLVGGSALPEPLWKKRLLNEVKALKDDGFYRIKINEHQTPTRILVYYADAPAYRLRRETPVLARKHSAIIELPREYPMAPPEMKFRGRIYHPNIFKDSKLVCMNMLNNWDPRYTILQLIRNVEQILWSPNLDDPAHREANLTYELNPISPEPRPWTTMTPTSVEEKQPVRTGPRVAASRKASKV